MKTSLLFVVWRVENPVDLLSELWSRSHARLLAPISWQRSDAVCHSGPMRMASQNTVLT